MACGSTCICQRVSRRSLVRMPRCPGVPASSHWSNRLSRRLSLFRALAVCHRWFALGGGSALGLGFKSSRGSRHRRIFPFGVFATTMELIQSVGWCTFFITPLFSNSAKWAYRGAFSDSGIFRGGSCTGLILSLTSSCNSGPNCPSLSNTSA